MIQDDIRAALAAMPTAIEPELSQATRDLYTPLHAGLLDGIASDLDQAYGPHERQRLDVRYRHSQRHAGIVIFVHGGGFVAGDKRAFANIGAYFARNGLLGITINYRLAPEHRWPSGAQDVAAAAEWARANAARYDADAGRIVVIGHSAGASHCATFVFDPEIAGHREVACAVLISGPGYVLRDGNVRGNLALYFGTDSSQYLHRSATSHVGGTRLPVMLVVAERDPGFLVLPSLEMASALTRRDDRCPTLLRLAGHNHFSPPSSLGTSDYELGAAVLSFIAGCEPVPGSAPSSSP